MKIFYTPTRDLFLCIRSPSDLKIFMKNYFRILRPTNTIISPGAANTSVAPVPAVPVPEPAAVPPLVAMTARMLNRLPVASAKVSLSLSRYGKHRHPTILPQEDPAASIQNTVPETVRVTCRIAGTVISSAGLCPECHKVPVDPPAPHRWRKGDRCDFCSLFPVLTHCTNRSCCLRRYRERIHQYHCTQVCSSSC